MAVTEAFRNDVKERNIMGIRIMMKNSMLVDPSCSEFDEMAECAKNVDGLYDEHDGSLFVEDMSQWDDSYMNKTMVEMIDNFSHERIDHLKRVVQHLRPLKKTNATSHNSSRKNGERIRNSSKVRKELNEKNHMVIDKRVKVTVGAVAGGTIGGTVAGVAGGSVLVGIAAGAVIVGAVTAILTE